MKVGDIVEAKVEWPGGRATWMRGKLVALTEDEVFLETELGAVAADRATAEVVEVYEVVAPGRPKRT